MVIEVERAPLLVLRQGATDEFLEQQGQACENTVVDVGSCPGYWVCDGVEGWAAERRAEGWTVDHGPVTAEGFPVALRIRIEGPRMAHGDAAFFRSWRGPATTVSFRPWDPRRIGFSAPGTHHFALGPRDHRRQSALSAAEASGRMILDQRGRMQRMMLKLDGARFTPAADAPETTARSLVLSLGVPQAAANQAVEPHQRPSLHLTAEVADIDLPRTARPALGRRIENLALTATVKGRLAGTSPTEALAVWRDNGGILEIERLQLKWAALGLGADGTMALDANMQPEGAMTARITGFRKTVDALVGAGAVRPRDAVTARIVLNMLAKTPADGGPPVITAPLSAQDGRLYAGPVALMRLPVIRWD